MVLIFGAGTCAYGIAGCSKGMPLACRSLVLLSCECVVAQNPLLPKVIGAEECDATKA